MKEKAFLSTYHYDMTDEISEISETSGFDRQSYVIYMPKFVYDIV